MQDAPRAARSIVRIVYETQTHGSGYGGRDGSWLQFQIVKNPKMTNAKNITMEIIRSVVVMSILVSFSKVAGGGRRGSVSGNIGPANVEEWSVWWWCEWWCGIFEDRRAPDASIQVKS